MITRFLGLRLHSPLPRQSAARYWRFISAFTSIMVILAVATLLVSASTRINWSTQIQNFPAGCSASQFVSTIAAVPTCGQPLAGLADYYVVMSGGDVALTSTTFTSILSQTVTMPTAGCPCRVQIQYHLYWTSNNSTFDTTVGDGTRAIASAQGMGTGTNTGGIGASQLSQVTYANSAAVTFTLFAEANGTGNTIKQTAAQNDASLTAQPSWMSLTIVPSN